MNMVAAPFLYSLVLTVQYPVAIPSYSSQLCMRWADNTTYEAGVLPLRYLRSWKLELSHQNRSLSI